MTAKQDKGEGRNQEEGERLRLPGCGGAGGRASKSRLPPAPLQDSHVPAQPLGGERAKRRQLWDSVVREHFWAFPLTDRASLDTVHVTLSELLSPY